MNDYRIVKSTLLKCLLVAAIAFSILALTPKLVLADEPYLTECKETENCTANDFGILSVYAVSVNSPGCIDYNGDGIKEVDVSFKIDYPAGQPTRYDLGSILALDGMEPLRDITLIPGSDCARDWLPGSPIPLTTTLTTDGLWPNALGEFWNGEPGDTADTCGDLPPAGIATRSYDNIRVACVDQDNNGQIDLSICLYYDNNARDTCASILDATEGTTAKCDCQRINIPVSPTAITLKTLKAGSALSTTSIITLGIALGVASLSGFYLVWRAKRRFLNK